jgi:hypothetical protein
MTDFFKKNVVNPLEKLATNEVNKLINKAENSLLNTVSDALGRLGLSSKSRSSILSGLGDSILSGIASEFFGGFSGEVNRLSKQQIAKNTGFTGTGGGDASTDYLRNLSPAGSSTSAGLQFPSDLGEYYVSFQFREYKRPTPGNIAIPEPAGDIALPLPKDLVENFDLSYSTGTELGIYGAVADNLNSGGSVVGNAIGGATYVAQTAASGVSDSLTAVLQQKFGALANPNVSTTFQSPKLRSHKFSWLMAPNNEEESNNIRDIINKFKTAALPNFASDTTNILTYPQMCQIVLYPWGAGNWSKDKGYDPNYLYVFKTCMIESVAVNYAPDALVFFPNQAPAFISLSVNFIEVEYFTAADFGKAATRTASDIGKDGFKNAIKDIMNTVDDINKANADIPPDGDPNQQGAPTGAPPLAPAGQIGGSDIMLEIPVTIPALFGNKKITLFKGREGQWYEQSDGRKGLKKISNINEYINQYDINSKTAIQTAFKNLNVTPTDDAYPDSYTALTDRTTGNKKLFTFLKTINQIVVNEIDNNGVTKIKNPDPDVPNAFTPGGGI